MRWETIEKTQTIPKSSPNLIDYDQTRSRVSWEAVRHELDGLPGDKGLTDCLSSVVMSDEEITEALTADEDFEQAGFKALLRETLP